MADTRSGAAQALGLRHATTGAYTTVAGPGVDHGFTGFSLIPAPSQASSSTGGLTTTRNTGSVVLTGALGLNETEVTLPVLLGRNGQRLYFDWSPYGEASPGQQFAAVCTVSRVFNDRGERVFEVDFTVDGDISTT